MCAIDYSFDSAFFAGLRRRAGAFAGASALAVVFAAVAFAAVAFAAVAFAAVAFAVVAFAVV
ncbi:MAG: hypothetical protein ABIZ57_07350, partial [Candidatus Limnocylindria bacterium]